MKRSGVTADDALCCPKESAQGAHFTIVANGFGVAAGSLNGGSEGFFAGTVVDDAGQATVLVNALGQFPEAVDRPTFGAPTTAGAEDDVVSEPSGGEIRANFRGVLVFDTERKAGDWIPSAGARRELAILVSDVNCAASHTVCIENGDAELTNCGRRKADAPGAAAEEWKEGGLPKALIIDRGVPADAAELRDDVTDGSELTRIDGPNFRGKGATLDEFHPARMGEPNDASSWKGFTKTGNRGKRVDDIAERAEADDDEVLVRHEGLFEWNRGRLE